MHIGHLQRGDYVTCSMVESNREPRASSTPMWSRAHESSTDSLPSVIPSVFKPLTCHRRCTSSGHAFAEGPRRKVIETAAEAFSLCRSRRTSPPSPTDAEPRDRSCDHASSQSSRTARGAAARQGRGEASTRQATQHNRGGSRCGRSLAGRCHPAGPRQRSRRLRGHRRCSVALRSSR